ncbi:glycosyltransferase family 39 protein [Nodosilinea sp. LEGE 07298]|uniref:ArnT family glycosyltransferase n=1 Tax=Nodosilinea sp. LEGE 07298 TaxID=2777970 RepID=UPI0018829B80|nr:glycosyltransferase family 39 protein [Nodosilinea sp. LEGE 07298]MBE9110398.1 glycosyltransferase family 39 protein [Nodosilinea sp. LEGE 07298]
MSKRWVLFQSPIWHWGRWFLLGFLVLRVGFWLIAFPNPDEAYYWLWGQRPGFSYYDHPPFHAWVQGLFAVLGRSTLVLRLPNAISSGILGVTFYHICRYLYGEQGRDRVWLVVLLGLSSPLLFWYLGLAWHDHWLVTFAVISSFLFVRYVDEAVKNPGIGGNSQNLYGAALFLGLAGLCKYNALFVGLGFLALIVTDKKRWLLLRDRRLYLALGLLLLVLSPILIWNIQHDFFSFRFYRDRTAGGSLSLNLLQPLVFLTLCGLILGPIQTWSIGRLLGKRGQTAITRTSCYPALALWIFGLSTAAFTALSTVSVALFYWNILAYPLLLPLLSDRFYRPEGAKLVRAGQLAIAQGLGLFAATALVGYYTVIPFSIFFGATDPDGAALFGWPQVAQEVIAQAQSLDDPLLLTTDYRSASALAYTLDNPNVLAISGRLDQFDFWYDAAALGDRDAVLLGETWHPICPTHLAMFERVDPPKTLEVRRFGHLLQTYQIVRGYGFKAGPEGYPLSPDYPLAFTGNGEQCLPK